MFHACCSSIGAFLLDLRGTWKKGACGSSGRIFPPEGPSEMPSAVTSDAVTSDWAKHYLHWLVTALQHNCSKWFASWTWQCQGMNMQLPETMQVLLNWATAFPQNGQSQPCELSALFWFFGTGYMMNHTCEDAWNSLSCLTRRTINIRKRPYKLKGN